MLKAGFLMTPLIYPCQVGVSVSTTRWEITVKCVQLVTMAMPETATMMTASPAPAPTKAPVFRSPGARSSVPSVRRDTAVISATSV